MKQLRTTPLVAGVVGDDFEPFRDKRIVTLTVACPTCLAGLGERCVSKAGTRVTHGSRRRMAIRAAEAA